MTKKPKKTKKKSGSGDNFLGRLFAQTKLPAHVTEEQDWYLDTPDVRLTRVFTIVLILHVVAVGGILAFKMVEKASTPETVIPLAGSTESPASDSMKVAPAKPDVETPGSPAPAPKPPQQKRADEMKAGLVMEHPSAPGYRQYRVAAGDNLVGIAREMNVSAAGLRELNQLSEDTRLTPGKWLMVPGTGEKAPAAGKGKEKPVGGEMAKVESKQKPGAKSAEVRPIDKTPASASAKTAASKYQVQKGDTFFGIARQFGLNYKDLMAANGIESPEGLQAGMELQIPGN